MILYIGVLTLLFLGGRGTDIGRLRPVEAVLLYEKAGILFLETDTGDTGWGLTVNQAVRKLKDTTPGEIYLDTADYLLLQEGMEVYLPAMRSYLKGKTKMVYSPKEVDLEAVADYLRVHHPTETIGSCQEPVEMLSVEGGKIILKKFQEK